MAAQIGQFALALAFVVTAYSIIASLLGIRLKNDNLIASGATRPVGALLIVRVAAVENASLHPLLNWARYIFPSSPAAVREEKQITYNYSRENNCSFLAAQGSCKEKNRCRDPEFMFRPASQETQK